MNLFTVSTIVVLAWGALAFGSEYSWGYAPLLVLSVVTGLLGVRASRGIGFPSRGLLVALALVFLAALLTVFPFDNILGLQAKTKHSIDFARLYVDATMQPLPTTASRTVSIAPVRTLLGLAFLGSFTVLLVGCTRGLSAANPKTLVRTVVILGGLVAFVGMTQAAARREEIYGFWRGPKAGYYFAPFANENHFAGWMVMALSLATGSFLRAIAPGSPGSAPSWRNRILRFASPEASEAILSGFGIIVMALSIVITLSRGGLVGLAAAILIASVAVLRRQRSASRRFVSVASLVVVLIVAAVWGGADTTIKHFQGAAVDIAGRTGVWRDAWRIVQDYPVTGTGLNTFGIAMLHYQTSNMGEHFVEAHNDYLQLAAEGGLLLGLPVVFALGLFVREVWRRFKEAADDAGTYWLRTGAVTGLGAIAIMEAFDFTLQMPGAAVLFVILAAIAIHRPDDISRRSIDATTLVDGRSL